MKTECLKNVPLKVSLEVGETELSLSDVENLSVGDSISLNALEGQPLKILVNGLCVGYAEVIAIGNNYGFRIVELKGK